MTQRTVDVAGTGFTVLDRIYAEDRKSFEALGGSCGNILISLAMLDRSVVPLLALGCDDVGESLVDEFMQAGAETSYIFRRCDTASPVLAQQLDTDSGQHWFSFICPETEKELPRYRPIEEADVGSAKPVLNACSVFYTDRLSEAIVDAMKTAADAGAVVYFEPSSVDDEVLFEHALKLTTILKFSSERLSDSVAKCSLSKDAIVIVTHGADGLEVRQDAKSVWRRVVPATVVRDTCGSGDMVSVGVIDWILARRSYRFVSWSLEDLLGGIVAGQRLAAANCAFAGARGLFLRHGPDFARMVLDDKLGITLSQLELFEYEPDL